MKQMNGEEFIPVEKTEEKPPFLNEQPVVEEEPKKKRGRKKKEPVSRIPYSIFNIELCKVVAGILPFTILSIVLHDEKLELTEDEKIRLAPLWDSVLEKHLPETIAKWSDELALASAISMLIIEKTNLLSKLNEKK